MTIPGFEQITGLAQTAHGDCLELMPRIPDGSVDMILVDLPYGTTEAPWDIRIDEKTLFKEFWRVDKGNAAVVLFGQFPFACELIMAARNRYRYKWVWKKGMKGTGFLAANRMPLRNHEDILVFYQRLPTYNPQYEYREPGTRERKGQAVLYGTHHGNQWNSTDGKRYPLDVLEVKTPCLQGDIHPTQKPVDLLSYLIRTYTNPGETVLDCTMGSGSTGAAAEEEGRRFIGIELNAEFYETGNAAFMRPGASRGFLRQCWKPRENQRRTLSTASAFFISEGGAP